MPPRTPRLTSPGGWPLPASGEQCVPRSSAPGVSVYTGTDTSPRQTRKTSKEPAPSMVDWHPAWSAHRPPSDTVGPRKRGIIEAYSMGNSPAAHGLRMCQVGTGVAPLRSDRRSVKTSPRVFYLKIPSFYGGSTGTKPNVHHPKSTDGEDDAPTKHRALWQSKEQNQATQESEKISERAGRCGQG